MTQEKFRLKFSSTEINVEVIRYGEGVLVILNDEQSTKYRIRVTDDGKILAFKEYKLLVPLVKDSEDNTEVDSNESS